MATSLLRRHSAADLSIASAVRYGDAEPQRRRSPEVDFSLGSLMTDAIKTPATSADSDLTRLFQCVCGHELTVSGISKISLRCHHCGRQISQGMLEQSMVSFGATVIGSATGETDDAVLCNGERLDHFSLMDQLGAGGMGAVYRARDESLQRFVAIKVIRSRAGEGDRLRRERLIQEARAQARVSHPNVVHIYYVGTHENCPFFAMEYVPGQSLAKLIQQQRLTFGEIVCIGLLTVDALRHSANLGIVHGDVKPGNILLGEHGSVKLSDFGLASCAEASDCGQSQTGPAGTLNYMAPEVAAGQPADVRSDMYSLGVMLYEMTFGELPLGASSDSLQESLRLRQQATVKFPAVWPLDRPESWKSLLSRLIDRDPLQRFTSFDELIGDLSALEPIALRRAGRISRFVAWILDMTVVGCLGGIGGALSNVVAQLGSSAESATERLMAPIFGVLGLFLIWNCRKLQSSPGKNLLQLRLVDEFGLPPVTWKLRLSIFSTYLVYVSIVMDALLDAICSIVRWPIEFEATLPGKSLRVLLIVWFAFNGLWLLFSRRQQCLTDRLLGLFVVLDPGKRESGIVVRFKPPTRQSSP